MYFRGRDRRLLGQSCQSWQRRESSTPYPTGPTDMGVKESGKGCCRVAMAMPQHCGAEGRFSPAHSYDGMDFFLPNRN